MDILYLILEENKLEAKEVIVTTVLVLNFGTNGCDKDIDDSTSLAYFELRQIFLISVSQLIIWYV